MAETLRKIISGEISSPELIGWLKSSCSQPDPRFTELKADFSINFLNHIRDCNAWLVPSIYVASLDSPSPNESSPSSNVSSPTSPCEAQENKKTISVLEFSSAKDAIVKNKSTANKKKECVLSITLGCESYENVRSKKYVKNSAKQSPFQNSNKQFVQDGSSLVKLNNLEDFPAFGDNIVSRCNIEAVSCQLKKIITDKLPLQVTEKFNIRLPYLDNSNPFQDESCYTTMPVQSKRNKGNSKKKANPTKSQDKLVAKNEVLTAQRENFPKLGDNSLLQRRIEPVSSQLKSLSIQPFPQPSSDELKDDGVPCYVVPNPSLLQNEEKLYLFETIYNALFSYGLVPNQSSELYFLFQLLSSAVDTKKFVNGDHILSTIHNCVHFSVSALLQQCDLLTLLDNATLILLCKIPYLKSYSPELIEFIVTHTNEKAVVRKKKKTYIDGVPYREDTDTRLNFPNDESFNSFSKQRNLFYDILSMWENAVKQSMFDASFERIFIEKVKLLMDLGSENYNYYHLAQLFYKQLLVSCLYVAETSDGYDRKSSSHDIKAFQSLKLFEKLSSCTQTDNFSALRNPQTFFEAFLLGASSVQLNDYLLNLFTSQIVKLSNPNNFSEIEERSEQEIHEKFSTTLHTLRLLAKFYGFISFMAYRSPKPLPKQLLDGQKELRQYGRSPLDFKKMLNFAIKKQCLVMIVPWVVEYLSMMDQVAPNLEQYLDICKILAKIYRGYFRQYSSPMNYEFVRMVIGALVQMPNFPLECLFYNYEHPEEDSVEVLEKHLDFQNVVDKQLVYSCCPYLAELKLLIDNFLIGVQKKNHEIGKISSKPSTLWQESDELNEKQNMEMEMEENFFFSHPVFLKQTVDFVAERITSRVISEINNKIEKLKTEAVDKIAVICREQNRKDLDLIFNLSAIESESICKNAQRWLSVLLQKPISESNISPPFHEVKQVLPQLFSHEVDPKVVDMSCRIASRMIVQKVLDWMHSNIVPEKISANIKNRAQKVQNEDDSTSFVFDEEEIPPLESMNARLPFDYIRTLQNMSLELTSNPDVFSTRKFVDFCSEVTVALKENYLPFYVIEAVVWVVIDIVTNLIVRVPKKCTTKFLQDSVNFFSSCPMKLVLPSSFLNCQVLYLQTLSNSVTSWKKLAALFDCAITSNLFSADDFNECVMSVADFKWTANHLFNFSKFLQAVSYKNKEFTNFTTLLQSVNNFQVQSA